MFTDTNTQKPSTPTHALDVRRVESYVQTDVLLFTEKKWRTNTMAEQEVKLMKGNEALAHAAIRCGVDGYFGYPITPQTEIIETLAEEKPWETTGMVVVQAESEVASINMVYGGGGCGKKVMTSSSSPGVALMQEGISYMAGAEVPGLIVDVQRGVAQERGAGTGRDDRTAAGGGRRTARRPWSRNHPALTERLFPGYTRWWQRRLLCNRTCS